MKVTSTGMKTWKDADKRMSDQCNLCLAKQGDLKKIIMCCAPKYHHQALLTTDNLKANEQIPNKMTRRPSPGKQSSHLVVKRHDLMKSFHQLVKRC